MAKSLVIVESPAKARTLEKFLGKDFKVLASYGHIRDLPRKGLGVDRAHGYKPTYEVLKGKEKTLGELKKAARASERVYLAADPDREGEAISWHLLQELKPGSGKIEFKRARFNEITKKAVQAAVENAGAIDENRVGAQQARRIIDRLVGYEVSDLLWKKIWRGLSAGRVQTVALRIICEREKEIEAFVPVEYWSLDAKLAAGTPPEFSARLFSWNGEKLKFDGSDPKLADGPAADRIRREIEAAPWTVERVEKSERRKSPPPPFITSQLQQAASRRLGFSVRRTMQIAQRLYEGREIPGRGTVGLITYMRTDSTRTADDALAAVRAHIGETYGTEYLPDAPRFFRSRAGAQEAHEAIRPTMLDLPPSAVGSALAGEEAKLYRLIWERFVASQMNPAVFDVVTADIAAGPARYRATGSTVKFAGYLAVYGVAEEDEDAGEKEGGSALPPLAEGEALRLVGLAPEQHFTQPPPRFNEASLVKYMEENGIGRPSTYAEILRKIEDREYVRKKDKRFYPTALGRVVIEMLIPYFDDFFETGYTARLEEELDQVEEGKVTWTKALADFDKKFTKDRDRALAKMVSQKAGILLKDARKAFGFALVPEIADTCPKDAKALKLRMGKNGLFIACSGYPDCDFTYHVPETEEDATDLSEYENQSCEECGSPMKLREAGGRPFLGCSAYPKCRNTVAIAAAASRAAAEPQPTGEKCPECGGDLVKKRGRFGEFVACANYPKCKYRPPKPVVETGVACPKDGGRIVERRGRFGFFYP
ncbi:MAG TPA: type I DNA topoisomerase, partial [Thermoanaerobaculia bacterium]|nr:type I DNA topoisomerase [Thermoanaerobaculia bacterium]